MTGYEFAGYAFVAFLSLCFASGLALYYQPRLNSSAVKAWCWVVPVGGACALLALLYAAYGTETGGFPLFHFGILGVGCLLLAITLPVLQLVLILIVARRNR